ncbi:MAG: hypothetical protein RLW68_02750 [Devosia marina]|uniref:ABM domain-containing protein n=1 Tax=Devosia marina TaxID=2683198 RepID=A0A7X3FRE4_9HYPH|nr:hypothetical protein [Devosia marina]MVS99369.1 hypothetical protein [Devosia marina]
MQILELVTFRLAIPDRQAFLAANDTVSSWAQRQPGFVSRTLSEGEDGQWIDMVVWASDVDARTAAAEMSRIMQDFDAMMMIDPGSVVMRHSAVRLAA